MTSMITKKKGSSLLKITKKEDGSIETREITGVRYGDLVIPSEAETREFKFSKEMKKFTTIKVT